VRADFKSIASLCGWSADDADSCCGAKDQLASLDKYTLLILDNCDDPRTNYSRYIPNSPRVNVILTTRLFDAGKYATPDLQHVSRKHFLRLTGLDEESAVALILEASEVQEHNVKSDQQARHIADVLDCHPLALVVASSLIQSTTYSLEEYAEALALATRFTQSELLDTESEQATYRKVSATFEVSADTLMNLAKTDPSAHDALALLDILGFFRHQGVSRTSSCALGNTQKRSLQDLWMNTGQAFFLPRGMLRNLNILLFTVRARRRKGRFGDVEPISSNYRSSVSMRQDVISLCTPWCTPGQEDASRILSKGGPQRRQSCHFQPKIDSIGKHSRLL
jgi:hypothetical protein